jgi:hypothetical protein
LGKASLHNVTTKSLSLFSAIQRSRREGLASHRNNDATSKRRHDLSPNTVVAAGSKVDDHPTQKRGASDAKAKHEKEETRWKKKFLRQSSGQIS